MAQRTTEGAVRKLLAGNWDGCTGLQQFIDSATPTIDRVATCATDKGITLTATELELIERWYAAHLYTQVDPLYQSRSTGRGSGSFMPHGYKDGAIAADPSGCLAAILAGKKRANAVWLGKPPSEQTAYVDRD